MKLARLDWPADAPPLRAAEVEVSIREGDDVLDKLITEALK